MKTSLGAALLGLIIASTVANAQAAPEAQSDNRSRSPEGRRIARLVTPTQLAPGARVFQFQEHQLAMIPPAASKIKEVSPEFGKVVVVEGPKRDNSAGYILTATIAPLGEDEEEPTAKSIADSVLEPYRARMGSYGDEPTSATANGITYEGFSFTGMIEGNHIKGRVLVAIKNRAVFVFFMQDHEEHFVQADAELVKMLETANLS